MSPKALLQHVDDLLAKKEDHKLKSLLSTQNFHDVAHVINELESGKRKTFVVLPPEIQSEVILRLTDRTKEVIFPRLSDHTIARFLHFNDEDDAVDILQFLPEERKAVILQLLRHEKRAKIEKLLTFGPETAGGLMDLNFIIVKPEFTLKDVADKVKQHMELQKEAPLVVVTNVHGKAIGFVPYKTLILAQPTKTVSTLIHPLPLLSQSMDQEKVLKLAIREKNEVLGVTDDKGQILGIIHLKDLLKIAQLEATEDVYKFAGVSREEEVLDPPLTAVRMRYRWLIVNLATAFLAAFVVSFFEGTISKMAILAAYMPIVAGMGGNAATQTLAVVVRGLALGEATWKQTGPIIIKEGIAGLINGVITGAIAAVVAYLLPGGNAMLGVVLGLAMVINLVVAGIFGALIPLFLKLIKIDPAVASTVFVTTFTDVCGFFAFLGLATLMLT
jgi:magnesium transporter